MQAYDQPQFIYTFNSITTINLSIMMTKVYSIATSGLILALLSSCNKEPVQPTPEPINHPIENPKETPNKEEEKPQTPETPNANTDFSFRPKTGQELLLNAKHYSERLRDLLNHFELKGLMPMGETQISPSQLQEIKAKADEIVAQAGAKTQREKHDALFRWIAQNIAYEGGAPDILSVSTGEHHTYNTAYTTFKGRKAICQGYANLLKAMCHTQGISAAVVNGFTYLNRRGFGEGHAWNYVYLDGEWFVSDPTFKNLANTQAISSPKYIGGLEPERIDFPLGNSSEFECMFTGGEVTIHKVKRSKGAVLTIPDAIDGVVITCFNPIEMGKEVRQIRLGAKIQSLGKSDRRFLSNSGLSVGDYLERIYVDPKNEYIEDYEGVLYAKKWLNSKPESNHGILLIPKQLKVVRLKPISVVDKNTIKDLPMVEEIYFPDNTTELIPSAVENCPRLQRVYLPKNAKYSKEAFYNCNPKLEIITR